MSIRLVSGISLAADCLFEVYRVTSLKMDVGS
jgi:hypothetical protein